jgi:hypothetical protein
LNGLSLFVLLPPPLSFFFFFLPAAGYNFIVVYKLQTTLTNQEVAALAT